EVEIGPAHEGRSGRVDVHVIEAAIAERRPGPEVLARGDRADRAGRDQVAVEHEHSRRVDGDLEVARPRAREPRMPAQTGRAGAGVATDLELEIEARRAQA